MSENIIEALIGLAGAVCTIIAAVIGKVKVNRYRQEAESYRDKSYVRFLEPNESFSALIPKVKQICMYTVNSHELLNKVNTILEQNPKLTIEQLTILVRKKAQERESDITILNTNISLQKSLREKGRIKKLTIIAYDHDPDCYYTLLGSRLVFFGHVYFDESKPTQTTVDYLPLIINDDNEVGQQVIKNFQKHFDNMVDRYKDTLTLYSDH